MSDQHLEQSERVSRARERQRRRRERKQQSGQTIAPATRRVSRQVQPARGRELPQIDRRILQSALLLVGGGLFMVVLIIGVRLFKNDPPTVQPNALWLGTDWTYGTLEAEALDDLTDRIIDNEIGTVYARVSELNYDGTWTGRPDGSNRFAEVQDDVIAFVERFRTTALSRNLYGTVHVRVDIGEDDGYRLDNETVQQLIADFSTRVVTTLGFDGVLLVIEPVWNNDENFLNVLRQVRQAIGSDALLGVAVPPDWTPQEDGVPVTSLIAPGTIWDREYKQRVALVGTDHIVLQTYNSYLTDEADYSAWVAYQVRTYAEAIGDLGTSTRVLVGVPTYESILPAHDERIENISAAIVGVVRGLEDAGEMRSAIQGLALYAEWDTDEIEWEQLRSNWVNR
ncbi:MAG: hypothetical protein ACOCX5_03500 [Chloroflexota bacterium]